MDYVVSPHDVAILDVKMQVSYAAVAALTWMTWDTIIHFDIEADSEQWPIIMGEVDIWLHPLSSYHTRRSDNDSVERLYYIRLIQL
ncbi:hypothetical protein PHLCEN_2v757 [Hermanssonia centrifuga]|uniref:Uncharacterized protein n=1 Tax=Hermanssonia centrifuga TaxID=98765 RepID=A0A2R6S563_9APHY|nr:hypothetical protein PHLCEN_2v757 [Hermanssonia centrifuga]